MDFKDIVQRRRSIRKYTDQPVSEEDLRTILRAALMAPTGHSLRSWQFFVVRDKDTLEALSRAKDTGAEFLAGASVAVVVAYDIAAPTWIEDASIAAVTMQYQAAELGIGSCWAQLRDRTTAEGQPTRQYLQGLLGVGEGHEVVCAIGFGYPAIERKPQDEEKLKWEEVRVI